MILQLKPNERGAIIGQTGTGKSVLARNIIPHNRRLAIIDPKRMFEFGDIPVFDNYKKLLRNRPHSFIYRPMPKDLANLDAYDKVYEYVYNQGNIYCYTDDIIGVIERNKYPHYLQVCYQMGRQKHVTMLSTFQRPSRLPLFLCSEACKYYVFRLTLKNDVQRVSEFVLGYEPNRLHDKYTFLYYDVYTMDLAIPCRVQLRR